MEEAWKEIISDLPKCLKEVMVLFLLLKDIKIGDGKMKKLIVLLAVMGLVASSQAALADIEFSPGGPSPGYWSYVGATSTSGTFSFIQDVDIDFIQGAQTDALYDQFVYLPDLALSSYVPGTIAGTGTGVVTAGGVVEIQDSLNNVLLAGTLASGSYHAIFATSVIYPEVDLDITVTAVDHIFGSTFLNGVSVGDYFDLNLTLQASSNFDTMIVDVETGVNGFSGSMTTIPEPATMVLLGLGALLLRRKK